MLEKDLEEFRYPLKIDIKVALKTLSQDIKSAKYLDINNLNYSYIHKAEHTCKPHRFESSGTHQETKPYLVILVKSKLNHFENRETIRRTWGQSDQMRLIRTVFLIGLPSPFESDDYLSSAKNEAHQYVDIESLHKNEKIVHRGEAYYKDEYKVRNDETFDKLRNESLLYKLELEYEKYGDIVQQNFYDTYYNNTIKTFMGVRWVTEYCSSAKFYLFIDDDYYLNPNLLMKHLYENVTESMMKTYYAGYVFPNSSPMRHMLSKWYISLKDYPYHKFPPFVAAGCYILTRESAELFFMASKLIELFKFDDIYMGILAHKLDIKPIHIDSVHFWAPTYYPSVYAREVIAAHKFSNKELAKIWSQIGKFINFNSSSLYIR
jgi:hypothetical protein